MSDKLRQGIAVVPEFTEGEKPTPAKLNALGSQLKRATEQVEQAVGDTLGQSWPYVPTSSTRLSPAHGRSRSSNFALTDAPERALDIASLARLIGPASNLNPRMLEDTKSVADDVPIGVHEFSLRYKPDDSTSVVLSDAAVFTTLKASASELDTAGDYYIGELGHVYCASISNGGTAVYDYTSSLINGGVAPQGARFNVMPDPNQLEAGGLGVAFSAKDGQGRYPATLPVITHQQSNIEGSSVVLDSNDVNFGVQLQLPGVLTENFTPGEEIPAGFVYLKNFTTNEVYEDGVYYYNGATSVLVGNIEIDSEILNGDLFQIVTIGTDITSSIDDLRVKSFHSHDRSHGEPLIPVKGLIGVLADPTSKGAYVPSSIIGNVFPQYIHRDGYEASGSTLSDKNAMRGDIVFGLTSGAPGSYLGAGETYGIHFGTISGPGIWTSSGGGLEIDNPTDSITITTPGNFIVDSGDANILGGLRVTGTHTISVYASMGLVVTEGIEALNSPIVTGSAVCGPTDTYDKWEIDDEGAGLPVTSDTWVCPRIQHMYIGGLDAQFLALDSSDASVSTPATLSGIEYWELTIDLPTHIDIDNVLGVDLFLKPSGSLSSAWYSDNITQGPQSPSIGYTISGSGSPSQITISIYAQRGSTANNPWHYDNGGDVVLSGGDAGKYMFETHYRLMLRMAAPGANL